MNYNCEDKNCTHCSDDGKNFVCDMGLDGPSYEPSTCEHYENFFNTKPPLGVKPAYIVAEDRIKELAEAIVRLSEEGRCHTEKIILWAKEIQMQCLIMQCIKEEKRK